MNKYISILTTIALAQSAFASQMDYTGLEMLFGEPVTTSAIGKPQRVSDVPMPMTIITGDEIQKSGALDLPQLLRRVLGMDVTRNFLSHADVNVRGYNQVLSNRLLVLVNGRQVYMDNFGMTLWQSLTISTDEIKQIEVVKGPNTSLFGFNAASGVINIVTYNPLLDDETSIKARVGARQYIEGTAQGTAKLNDNFGMRASVSSTDADDFSRGHYDAFVPSNDTLDRKSANVDAVYTFSDAATLRTEAGYNYQSSDMLIPFTYPADLSSLSKHLYFNYDYDAGQGGLWNAAFFINEVSVSYKGIKFSQTYNRQNSHNHLRVYRLTNLRYLTPDHTLRVSGEYRDNAIHGPTIGDGEGRFTMNVYSLSSMWHWLINDEVDWTLSGRYDHWKTRRAGGITLVNSVLNTTAEDSKRDENEFSMNAGLVWRRTADETWRVYAARGLHVPSLVELGWTTTGASAENYGNPTLSPEVNHTIGVDALRHIEPIDLDVNFGVYHEHLQNVIAPALYPLGGTGGGKADLTFANVGKSSAWGVELGLSNEFKEQFHWQLNYTYLIHHETSMDSDELALDFKTNQAKHKISLMTDYEQGKWNWATDTHFVSGTNYTATVGNVTSPRKSTRLGSYVVFNTQIGYKLSKGTKVSLDGYNLLSQKIQRPSYIFAGGVLGGNVIGRQAVLTVSHAFD